MGKFSIYKISVKIFKTYILNIGVHISLLQVLINATANVVIALKQNYFKSEANGLCWQMMEYRYWQKSIGMDYF